MSIYPYDPRVQKDPLGRKSSSRRLLEDILAERIVSSLARSTASNYITEAYGANHRIFYEGIAAILAEFLVDSVDNIDDADLTQMRAEFISTRLLYSVFPPNESAIPSTDTIEELHSILQDTLKSLFKGSGNSSILEALNSLGSEVSLEIENFVVNLTSSILSITSIAEDHRHFVFSRPTGLGSTSYPIGMKWGDALHTHLVIDGVVQPYTDKQGTTHTHEASLGLSLNVLKIQENLRKVFSVLKPAHIKTGVVASLLEEDGTLGVTEDEMSLSLGEFHQEDMRKVRLGTWEDVLFGYASNKSLRLYRTNITKPNSLLIKASENAPSGQRRRVLSVSNSTPPSGDYPIWSFPLDAVAEELLRDIGVDVLSVDADGFVVGKNTSTSTTQILSYLGDGSLVLLNGVAYYLDMFLKTPVKHKLSAKVIQLDSVSASQGVVEITNLSSPWKVRQDIRYESYTFTYYPPDISNLWFSFPDLNIRFFYKGIALGLTQSCSIFVNGIELPADKIKFYSYFDNRFYVLNPDGSSYLNDLDRITIVYPYDEDEVYRFTALNDTRLVLNATRKLGQVTTTQGRKSAYSAPSAPPYYIRRKNFVLNKVEPISPLSFEQREASYGLNSTSTTNTTTQYLNSSFILNRVSSSSKVSNISAPATANLSTSDGKISFVQLGFKPDYILSITDTDGNEYLGTLDSGYLLVQGVDVLTTLEISAVSSNPLTSEGTWFSGEKLLEGQAPLKKPTHSFSGLSESTSNEIMSNPLGLAEPQIGGGYKDATRSVIARSSTTQVGVAGEPVFYEDRPTAFSVGGYLSELHTETSYVDEVLYGDYSLYTLGPISTTELTTFTTIPTYLFFQYNSLSLFGGNGYYFSIYRISSDGIKYYQTLYPIADGGGFECFEQHPSPPSGAPLAYRWIDQGTGSGFSLNYDNGNFDFPLYEADPNGYFNHIPNQTYYIEVYMEQNAGADELRFFSSGTNAPYALNTPWASSSEVYDLDDPMDMGFNKTYTFQVTFATNPGEVTSWLMVSDPDVLAPKSSEDVGASIEIVADVFYPSEPLHGDRLSFIPSSIYNTITPETPLISISDVVDAPTDALTFAQSKFIQENIPAPTDVLSTSYLILPSSVTETTQSITDSFSYLYRLSIMDSLSSINDSTSTQITTLILDSLSVIDNADAVLGLYFSDGVSLISDSVSVLESLSLNLADSLGLSDAASVTYGFVPALSADNIPNLLDNVSTSETKFIQDTLASITDSVITGLSGFNFSDVLGASSDEVETLYAYLPRTASDVINNILDAVLLKYSTSVSDNLSPILDSVLSQLSAYLLLDSVTFSDVVTTSYAYTPMQVQDAVSGISDQISFGISTNVSEVLSVTDDLSYLFGDSLSVQDSLSVTDSVITSYLYGNIGITESVAGILDSVITSYLYAAVGVSDEVVELVDSVFARIKSLSVQDSLSVTDSGLVFIASTNLTDNISITDSAGFRVPVVSLLDSVDITDEGGAFIASQSVSDLVPVLGDEISSVLELGAVSVSDLIIVSDSVVASYEYTAAVVLEEGVQIDDSTETSLRLVLSDSVSASTDTISTSAVFVPMNQTDSVGVVSDALTTSYLLLPSSVVESVPSVEDTTSLSLSLTSVVTEAPVSVSDDWTAYISSKSVLDSVDVITDEVLTTYDEFLSLVDGSILFSGEDTSYLVGADISAFDTSTNPFRVEWWMYLDSSGGGTNPVVFSRNLRGTSDRFRVRLLSRTGLEFSVSTGSASVSNNFGSVPNDEWVHIALVGRSSQIRAYVNGVQLGSTWSTTYNINNSSAANLYIGNETTPVADNAFKGYLTNLRYLYQISGTADLTTRTGTFSIPLAPLPSVSINVFRLVATDAATAFTGTGTTLSNTSSVSWSSEVPTLANPMSSLSLSGVLSYPYYNGYLSRTGESDFNLGAGDFTIEWFQYLTNEQLSTSYSHRAYIFDLDYPGASKQLSIYYDAALETIYLAYRINASTNYTIGFAVNNIRDRWSHFALIRYSGTLYLAQNGYSLAATKIDDSLSLVTSLDFTGASNGSLYIGGDKAQTANYYFNGYLSNFRMSVGVAKYTSQDAPFTPPSTQLSTDANTKLLLLAVSDATTDSSGLSNTMTATNVEREDFSGAYGDDKLSVAVQTSSTLYSSAAQFFVYSENDYYARQAQGDNTYPTLVSSLPRFMEFPTNALAYEGLYKGSFSAAVSAGYSNTSPTQADLIYRALSTSTINHRIEEYNSPTQPTEYKIFARLNNDASPTPEFNIAFKYTDNTWGSYYNLFPSTGALNVKRNYLHTLRVNTDGTTTFTQDTTGQTAIYPYATQVRLYAYFKNLDNGLGAAADPQSKILLRTDPSLGVVTGRVVSVPSEYSGTDGLIPKSEITNTNNVSQVSWSVTTGTKYRLYLDKDAGVDLILAFRAYTYSAGATDYNTLYDSNNPPDYRSFSNLICQQNLFLQVLEDGSILITQAS